MEKLIIFDLGDTLIIEYEGISLSWNRHYRSAIEFVLKSLNIMNIQSKINQSVEILDFYNTRVNKRTFEVGESEVLSKIARIFNADEVVFEEQFFCYFQRNILRNNESLDILKKIKKAGNKIAILTDVPYGMPKKLVLSDIGELIECIDLVITSCDIGYRKPSPFGLDYIMNYFGIDRESTYYIGNEEKDIHCAKNAGVIPILKSVNKNHGWGQLYTIKSLKNLTAILDIHIMN